MYCRYYNVYNICRIHFCSSKSRPLCPLSLYLSCHTFPMLSVITLHNFILQELHQSEYRIYKKLYFVVSSMIIKLYCFVWGVVCVTVDNHILLWFPSTTTSIGSGLFFLCSSILHFYSGISRSLVSFACLHAPAREKISTTEASSALTLVVGLDTT